MLRRLADLLAKHGDLDALRVRISIGTRLSKQGRDWKANGSTGLA